MQVQACHVHFHAHTHGVTCLHASVLHAGMCFCLCACPRMRACMRAQALGGRGAFHLCREQGAIQNIFCIGKSMCLRLLADACRSRIRDAGFGSPHVKCHARLAHGWLKPGKI